MHDPRFYSLMSSPQPPPSLSISCCWPCCTHIVHCMHNVRMYVHVFMHICLSLVYVCVYLALKIVCTCVCFSLCLHVCQYACMCVMYVCAHARMYICMCAFMCRTYADEKRNEGSHSQKDKSRVLHCFNHELPQRILRLRLNLGGKSAKSIKYGYRIGRRRKSNLLDLKQVRPLRWVRFSWHVYILYAMTRWLDRLPGPFEKEPY